MVAIDKQFIIDASVVLAWLLPDEIYSPFANKILDDYKQNLIKLFAPTLLLYEVINGLYTSVIRQRITQEIADRLVNLVSKVDIEFIAPNIKQILLIAIEKNLSAYDCSYLSIIKSHHLPMLTADKKMYRQVKGLRKKIIWIEDYSVVR